ncbi:MAG TPA: TIGR03435 family protein [Vicinamibacterales bacterium]|nr:TIGR03435 family protein [Vicinamibacterales bacterium]
MRRVFTAVAALALAAGAAYAQPPGSSLKFDAAAISVRDHHGVTGQPGMTGGVLRNGRYDLRNASMIDLIATAYSVTDQSLILEGPSWVEYDRFDIAAKAPQGTSQPNLRLMLQSLLAERFQLKLHNDTRSVDGGFVLTLGKEKHKLKEASGPGGGCQPVPPPQPPPPVPMNRGTCRGVTTEELANLLRGIGNGYVNGPVQDQTGLKGYWDFDVAVTPFPVLARAGSDGVSLFQFVERDLGLKLEPGKAPRPVTVIDSASHPSPDPPGVAAAIPAAPAMEFDVAEIKLSQPDAPPMLRCCQGGRIDGSGVPLHIIMQVAWDLTVDDLVANTPKWWDDTKYAIVAKSSTSISGTGQNLNADVEDLKAMIRQLVTERFKLKYHYEDRPVTAYTLVADKPKMAKADPANRTAYKEGPPTGQADQRNQVLGRMVTVKNMTMDQFAENLQRIAGGYIRVPVENKTGLDGSYDFTLTFSPIGLVNQGRGGRGGDGPAPAPGAADAADPTGALSLPDAINRQLGLKLEQRKRPMKVLVIDSVQEKPEDN